MNRRCAAQRIRAKLNLVLGVRTAAASVPDAGSTAQLSQRVGGPLNSGDVERLRIQFRAPVA